MLINLRSDFMNAEARNSKLLGRIYFSTKIMKHIHRKHDTSTPIKINKLNIITRVSIGFGHRFTFL